MSEQPVDERELVFNVVWTGGVFEHLHYFVSSLMHHSGARFRFVANGCTTESIRLMERYATDHDDRVVEVIDVSPDQMVAHGVALDAVLRTRDDGDYFCLVDADIQAFGPFLGDFIRALEDHAAVCSGKEVWNDDNVARRGGIGVGGRHFFDADGFVFGSPHFALYRRAAIDETVARWGVGFGSAGPDLRADAKAAVESLGHRYSMYDTGKLLNILLQVDGHAVTHFEHPALMHIGGVSHYLAPSRFVTGPDGQPRPDWVRQKAVAKRAEVAGFAARMLRELEAGRPAPQIGDDVEPDAAERLRRVRSALIELVREHGPPVR